MRNSHDAADLPASRESRISAWSSRPTSRSFSRDSGSSFLNWKRFPEKKKTETAVVRLRIPPDVRGRRPIIPPERIPLEKPAQACSGSRREDVLKALLHDAVAGAMKFREGAAGLAADWIR